MTGSWVQAPLIVPLDGRDDSVRAVGLAARVATRLGSPLTLISVVDAAEADDRSAWLRTIADRLPDADVTTKAIVSDDPAAAIVAEAGTQAVVCIATAGSVRFHAGHFGSIAEGVARAIGRPVLMVGPNVDPSPGERSQRVVVPVDGSELSERALGPAAELAEVLGVPLWIVSVVSPSEVAAAARHGAQVADEAGYVHNLARRVGQDHGLDVQYEVLHSDHPDRAIVDFVGHDATAVMTTHGRTGLRRIFAGSVAAGVVAHSQRAVAVLRPEEAE